MQCDQTGLIKRKQGHKAEVRERGFGRCYAAGFDGGGRGRGQTNAGEDLETGKDQETDSPLQPPEGAQPSFCSFLIIPHAMSLIIWASSPGVLD